MEQGDSAGQSEHNHGQIEHLRLHALRVGVILARFSQPDNRRSITVTLQGGLASADDEQLCDRNRESDDEQHEPELNHAPTSPQTGLRPPSGDVT